MTHNPPPFVLYDGERQVLESRPWISTAEFAENYFKLVTGPYKGQCYKLDHNPVGRMVMDLWDDPLLQNLMWGGPSQVSGKTTTAYACLTSEMYREPCSAAIGMPDEGTKKRIFKEKIGPHFVSSPELKKMLSEEEKAVQSTQVLTKFGAVYGMHAGSDASASSISPKIVVVDEEDAYQDIMAAPRMVERNESWDEEAKTLRVSKIRGHEKKSSLWQAMMELAQVIYQVRACCPNCGTLQYMDFRQIKVPGKMRDPKIILSERAARYHCIHCDFKWDDHHRNLAIQRGDLHAEVAVKNPTSVGVITPSWVFSGMSLSKVMSDWFIALNKGTPKAMEWFDNSHACKPYKVVTVQTKEEQVKAMVRHDRPPMVVPAEALALTMGVDTQQNSFYFVVRAWMRSGESQKIDYGELLTEADVEQQLDVVYPVEGRTDVVMPIWRSAIDIGGTKDKKNPEKKSRTLQVKLLVQRLARENFWAIKGASRSQEQTVRRSDMTVDKDVPKEYRETMTLMTLDTEDLKDLIFINRLQPDSVQPMWLHRDTGDDYFKQLSNEERDEDGKWIEKGANHYLDCEVYATACAHPDWAPALQLLPEPQYRKVAPKVSRRRVSSGYGSGGGGLVTNPFFGG